MELWLLSQDAQSGYDTYDSAVVAAESEDEARRIHPSPFYVWNDGDAAWHFAYASGETEIDRYVDNWAKEIEQVTVRHIGTALPGTQQGVVIASVNAG
jgi:hypothetical protein